MTYRVQNTFFFTPTACTTLVVFQTRKPGIKPYPMHPIKPYPIHPVKPYPINPTPYILMQHITPQSTSRTLKLTLYTLHPAPGALTGPLHVAA
jgi:hypothetical protein